MKINELTTSGKSLRSLQPQRSLRHLAVASIAASLSLTASATAQLMAKQASRTSSTAAEDAPPALTSKPVFYQVISGQLNELDPNSGGYTKLGAKNESYNAAGYNILDGYGYAWGRYAPYANQLVRIHGDGSVIGLGTPTTEAAAALSFSIYAGDMDYSGNLWIRGDRFNGPDLMKVNVNDNTYEMVRFSGVNPGAVADLVYLEVDGSAYFFGARNQQLYIWDLSRLEVRKVDVANLPEGRIAYGAAYTDADQQLFVSNNRGGVHQIINYFGESPRAVYLLDSAATGNNDGMSNPLQPSPIPVPENQPPKVVIHRDVVNYTNNRTVGLSPEVIDEGLPFDGNGLTYAWSLQAGTGDAKFTSTDTADTQISFSKDGSYTVRLSVSDGELTTNTQLFVSVEAGQIASVSTTVPEQGAYAGAREVWNAVKERLNCRDAGIPLELEKRGFRAEDFSLAQDSRVFVTLIYDGAAARNSLGWYDAKDPENGMEIWHDVATGPTAPLKVGSRADLGVLPAGTDLRFYLQPDGARGGESFLYQDAERNPDQMEQIAARIFSSDEENAPLVMGFEDIERQGDLDFNDVIFSIEIVPDTLGETQYDGVITERKGIHSDRGSRGVEAQLSKLGINSAGAEVVSQLFRLPDTGSVSIQMMDDRSPMKFDFCVFDYASVQHLNPSSLEFRTEAAKIATSIMDDRSANPGTQLSFDPTALGLAGRVVGFLAMPNNTREKFLSNAWRYTPKGEGNRTKRQPLFTINGANPGGLDQFLSFQGEKQTVFMFEDRTRFEDPEALEEGEISDHSFDDVSFAISPRLESVDLFDTDYAQGSADSTYGFAGTDGNTPRQPGETCCY